MEIVFNLEKIDKWLKNSFEVNYIFFGLTILGINKTPNTKSNNGAIITKKDSTVINS